MSFLIGCDTLYDFFVIQNESIYKVTNIVGNIVWSDNVDTLGMQLTFQTIQSDNKYFPDFKIHVGDKVIFSNENEIFRGIIVTQSITSNNTINYTCFDFAFYLNKSKIIKQFKGINASSAIEQLCSSIGIEKTRVVRMNKIINHIYKDTPYEVIKDIIQQESNESAKKYIMEMQSDIFTIFEQPKTPIIATFKPAYNIEPFDITKAIGNVRKTLSIEEMKNSVVIVSSEESSMAVLGIARDSENIKKFGLLQEVTTVDDKEKNMVQNIANNKLKEFNKIKETISIELIGNDNIRAGRILNIKESKMDMNGNFLIKSCNHTLSNGIHTMSVELEMIDY